MTKRCSECDNDLDHMPKKALTCSKHCRIARTRKLKRKLALEDKIRKAQNTKDFNDRKRNSNIDSKIPK